jgi:hypothetical protein
VSTPEEAEAFKEKVIRVACETIYKKAWDYERKSRLEIAQREYEKIYGKIIKENPYMIPDHVPIVRNTEQLIEWYEKEKGIKIDEIDYKSY